jgi:hypothetical protein
MNNKEIIITDKTIINFYEKNKQIDIVKINLLYIELFEKEQLNLKELNYSIVNTISNQTTNLSILKYSTESHKSDFNKYNNSNTSDNKLFTILSDDLPTAEIITEKEDFIIKRQNKQDILIETKNYSSNVKKEVVDNFIINVNNNNCHGIFISQNSGIINRENFQFEINNNKILIYIHKLNYEPYKIGLAIKLIDLLSDKFSNISNDNIIIPTDILKEINNEYQNLYLLKDKLINDLKDYTKKTLERYESINIPSLDTFLAKHYTNIKKKIYICEYCNNYECEKLISMARHKTSCKIKHDKLKNQENSDDNSDKPIKNKSKNILK